jgi:3-deoxy-D-manno-octulosonic-acid transferase
MRFRWLYCRVFAQIDTVYAQTKEDRDRLESLGADNVVVYGNIKFAGVGKPTKAYKKPEGILVCAGSTHDKEESLILEAFKLLKSKQPKAKLVIAPRHPERFDKVDQLMASYGHLQGWSHQRFSQQSDESSDILLLDKLGELVNFYAISDIVILGGAFEPIGGHNAAEAAQFGCRIISGKHYFNQNEIFDGIDGITVVEKDGLREALEYPKLLPQSKIKREVNLAPIIQEIEETL